MMHRRNFLTLSGLAGFATLPAIGEVLQQSFNIVAFGAQPGGRVLNTRSLQDAIDHAFEAGGGTVSVPPGIFLAGGLVLRSRVTLYLQAGAVLRGSADVNDYDYHAGPPQEGDANGRHLIFARDAEDIAIVGQGTIDGQGSAFWHRKGRPKPKPEEMWGDVIAWDYEPATQRRPFAHAGVCLLQERSCRRHHSDECRGMDDAANRVRVGLPRHSRAQSDLRSQH
jgi:polygalacturonase